MILYRGKMAKLFDCPGVTHNAEECHGKCCINCNCSLCTGKCSLFEEEITCCVFNIFETPCSQWPSPFPSCVKVAPGLFADSQKFRLCILKQKTSANRQERIARGVVAIPGLPEAVIVRKGQEKSAI